MDHDDDMLAPSPLLRLDQRLQRRRKRAHPHQSLTRVDARDLQSTGQWAAMVRADYWGALKTWEDWRHEWILLGLVGKLERQKNRHATGFGSWPDPPNASLVGPGREK